MQDMTISATKAIAYLLWTIGTGFVAASFFGPLQLAAVGLLLAGAGGVSQMRGYICGLQRRERDAFDLGRDSVRSLR